MKLVLFSYGIVSDPFLKSSVYRIRRFPSWHPIRVLLVAKRRRKISLLIVGTSMSHKRSTNFSILGTSRSFFHRSVNSLSARHHRVRPGSPVDWRGHLFNPSSTPPDVKTIAGYADLPEEAVETDLRRTRDLYLYMQRNNIDPAALGVTRFGEIWERFDCHLNI